MQVSVLMHCPPDSMEHNESLYIEALDTVHPRGYNLRCGSKAGVPSPCGMELSTLVVDHTEATDEMRKILKEDIDAITGTRPPASSIGVMVVSIDDINPMCSASTNSEKGNGFPLPYNTIRFSRDMSMVDVMDCLMFVSASHGAARVFKTTHMSSVPTVDVVWEGSFPKRKRVTCTVDSMLKVLAPRSKFEARILFARISSLAANGTQYPVAEEVDTHSTNNFDTLPMSHASMPVRTERCAEADALEKLKTDLKMDRLEKKIKFCKSVGDEERVDRLMKVYINMH
jgi:hypothetical protein